MAGYDITEPIIDRIGSGELSSGSVTNADVAYDIAINGDMFLLAASENYPYRRETASYRRQQIDQTREPGEQSLEGWWFRSQSSFHLGSGIKYLEPLQGDSVIYRFNDSMGVSPWTAGKVELLKDTEYRHTITSSTSLPVRLRSIRYNNLDWIMNHDGYDVDMIPAEPQTASITNKALTSNVATLTATGHPFVVGSEVVVSGVDSTFNGTYAVTAVTANTFSYAKTASNVSSTAVSPAGSAVSNVINWIDYNSGTEQPVYAICDDGTTAYWVTNTTVSGANKMHLYKRALNSTGTVTTMFNDNTVATSAVMEWVKGRIILAVNNSIYQLTPSSSSLPAALYTHPNTSVTWTGITDSGAAIYISGYAGTVSSIIKLTVNSTGGLPTLSDGAVIAATMPRGELIHSIYYYLGRMMIGTNKGVRVAVVSDTDGSIVYGPLLFTTTNPVQGFAGRDRFVWCSTEVGGYAGTIRIDLSTAITDLVYPWANDSYNTSAYTGVSRSVAFAGTSDRMAWACSGGEKPGVYVQYTSRLMPSGYITTGLARFNTLEPKHFKFVKPRAELPLGGDLSVTSVDKTGFSEELILLPQGEIADVDVGIRHGTSQESMQFKFLLTRNTSDTSKGAVLYGYQIKALPALRRARMLMVPLMVFDWEVDRYNMQVGYEGRAWERLSVLESLEATGDVITLQDYTNNETVQGVIEKLSFDRTTPPNRRFSGFGGIAYVQVRTVA